MDGSALVTDGELVRRVLDGSTEAFAVLVDRHAPACIRFATRMLGNREDAEEASQEALMRAYRSLGIYDERTAFRTWLFTILTNRCRTALLHRGRRERRVIADEYAVATAADESSAEALDFNIELARALDVLPADQREAFLLKYVEQLEYTEMAAMTGDGVSALKMRVRRACARLRRELGEGV